VAKGKNNGEEGKKGRAKPPLSIDHITDVAYNGFQAKWREAIPRDEVKKVVAELNLAKVRPAKQPPRLMIHRLRFQGEKNLDDVSTPIDYDQPFDTGVNAIIIEDNLVGKSSILKTIKFALTGNDEDFDQSIREWIRDIWLEFSLGGRRYTMLLARREDGLHGTLAPGEHFCPIEDVPEAAAKVGFYHRGDYEIQQALDSFFSHEFGLEKLGWNVASSEKDGGSNMAWASWRTYFLALRIPDDNHTYFICKPEIANQEQILFSTFLGLHLTEPLNRLSMEAQSLKKDHEFSKDRRAEQAKREAELIDRKTALRRALDAMDAEQSLRLKALTDEGTAEELTAVRGELAEKEAEVLQLEGQMVHLATQSQQAKSLARRLREQIDLSRELTGLQVSLCPNCASAIDDSSVQREKSTHQCRLCVKPVPPSSEEEAEILEAAAKEWDREASAIQSRKQAVNRHLITIRRNRDALRAKIETLRDALKEKPASAFPTAEEAERRGRLHEEIGEINHEMRTLEIEANGLGKSHYEHRGRIIEKVKEVIKQEADERNREVEDKLNELAQEVIAALRADQISGIRCHPTGVVKLTKNGKDVSFSKINNPGERYRAKLALFLAMMRLGCEAGLGKHPGFLMLDQLGAAEMVPDDLAALAAALKRIEEEYSERVQIICFTAKPQFREATVPEKIYGPQGRFEHGKPYAF
jgi:hypothetical protein